MILGAACLFTLQGIPCLYYGTEQGLRSARERYQLGVDPAHLPLEAVREALWGRDDAAPFDPAHPFYRAICRLSELRAAEPALRYGRQYFRPLSGDGVRFGVSPFSPGVIAFSRILNDAERLVVVNTQTEAGWSGEVIVDFSLNPPGTRYGLLFTNRDDATAPDAVRERAGGSVLILEPNGVVTQGPIRVLPVSLKPMEVQILAPLDHPDG